MSGPVEQLSDVTLLGRRTRLRGVRAANIEMRPWLQNLPLCQTLSQYQILHAGIQETTAPMKVVRTHQTTTYFLASFRGKGLVLIDGAWRVCPAGYASLLPAHALNAFKAISGSRWEFCWVCYGCRGQKQPIADSTSPVIARFNVLPLHSAILGLIYESNSESQPTLTQGWVDLVNAYVLRFAQAIPRPDRLRALWERLAANLADDWSLARLAREAGYSREHLRRLCRKQLGRSPMHQITYLRMRRAAELLTSTDLTIEAIAHEVGYHNPFVLSNAFTKWIGRRPSEYRRKANGS
jgi:AraC-like DNA-binding protein